MIDVSQRRASIGLWNYCQAASSRPANGRPVGDQSKSDNTRRTKQKSSLVLSFIVVLLFISVLSSGYLKFDYKPHPKGIDTD